MLVLYSVLSNKSNLKKKVVTLSINKCRKKRQTDKNKIRFDEPKTSKFSSKPTHFHS